MRVLSSLVMVPLAIAVTWWGGWLFAVLWIVLGIAVAWEWTRIVRDASAGKGLWMAIGLAYAVALVAATVGLRFDTGAGLVAILFLFAVVWMTDIAAYFTGRSFGGPKLMPTVSPKKTWSGAIGGLLAGTAAGVAVAAGFGLSGLGAVTAVALVLSVVSQAGDLAESALKRRFGVKDSGGIIPGHGGVMDRLDGYAAAAIAAALLGLVRGGIDAPARGFLVW